MTALVALVLAIGALLVLADTILRARRPIQMARLSRRGPGAYFAPDGRVFQLRSGWERLFARWLDERELAWRYEPRTFVLSDGRRYTPDFWVRSPLGDCYVEIHRIDHPDPRDGDRIRVILRAQAELPRLDGLPLIVLGERELRLVARDVRRSRSPDESDGGWHRVIS